MSVSISFYLEVHQNNKWILLRWKQPSELETFFYEKNNHKWESKASVFYCDYGFINEFIDDYSQSFDGLLDDVTPELKRFLERDHNVYGTGYFDMERLSEYLNEKREEMLENLILSRDYQIVHKLNRIEKKLFGAKDTNPIDLSDQYYKSAKIRDIYESYKEEVCAAECLAAAIRRFASAFFVHVEDRDMRIVFKVW